MKDGRTFKVREGGKEVGYRDAPANEHEHDWLTPRTLEHFLIELNFEKGDADKIS